jgi:hypothetical protein
MAGEDPISTRMIRKTDELLVSSEQRLKETERLLQKSEEILSRKNVNSRCQQPSPVRTRFKSPRLRDPGGQLAEFMG